MYENITVGSEVLLVRATDRDSGDNKVVEYSLAEGSAVEHFYIDMHSGRITMKSAIDRDPPLNQTMFNITVGFSSEILVKLLDWMTVSPDIKLEESRIMCA